MKLSSVDVLIIVVYLLTVVGVGTLVSRWSKRTARSYFLGGNKIPWPILGISNASGMFDISGTMWMVYLLFVYGLKSVFIPWLWPSFNQIFLMVFLSVWLRRSGAMTGAEWITCRFGSGLGATLSHLVVVLFALVSVLGFMAYGFIGIGKFAAVFLPWQLSTVPHWNAVSYGLIVTFITALYVIKGGMVSIVFTEILQFFLMTTACIAVGVVAMTLVTPDMLVAAVPDGWGDLSFGWSLQLDWADVFPEVNEKIASDGYSMFGIFMMLALFKGVLQSLAGPAPNYDMQRILSTQRPSDAAKMSGLVSVVLLFPRYMMITGLTVLALVFFTPELRDMGDRTDFDQILPLAIATYIPSGLLGIVVAGLLATFMSTFAATANAAPAYLINDIYKRYINPTASEKQTLKMSYLTSLLFIIIGAILGIFIFSLNNIVMWLVSALYGGYTASNLLKWYWWRFNGMGYFAGMVAGIISAVPLMFTDISLLYAFPVLFVGCLVCCIVTCLLTSPDDMQVLKQFYLKTRPWGCWGPVIEQLREEQGGVKTNGNFYKDTCNLLIGIIWHTALTTAPIFLVLKDWLPFTIAMAIGIIATTALKYCWWDHLEDWPQGGEVISNRHL